MQHKKFYGALLVLGALTIFSCKKILEKPSWNSHVVAPLVKTKLTVGNILTDTTVHSNSDSSISIVERQQLYSFGIDSLVSLTATPYHKVVNLKTLQLDPQVVTRKITLGEILRQIISNGGITIIICGLSTAIQ